MKGVRHYLLLSLLLLPTVSGAADSIPDFIADISDPVKSIAGLLKFVFGIVGGAMILTGLLKWRDSRRGIPAASIGQALVLLLLGAVLLLLIFLPLPWN